MKSVLITFAAAMVAASLYAAVDAEARALPRAGLSSQSLQAHLLVMQKTTLLKARSLRRR